MATLSEALAIAVEHYRAGRLSAAEQICRRILQAEPDHAGGLGLQGLVAHQAGQPALSAECLRRAVALDPESASYHVNLAAAWGTLGLPEEAAACCRRAIQIQPDLAEAHYSLATAFYAQGKLEEATAAYRRALEINPDYWEARCNLASVLQTQGNLDEAIGCYRRLLQDRPDSFLAHNNLGNALQDQGRPAEAVDCYRRAIQLKPDYAEAYNNLAAALLGQGLPEEARACYRQALELQPGNAAAHSNALLCEQYQPDVGPERLAADHAAWERQHAAPLRSTWRPHPPRGAADRPLRLGFVSPDFACHPVSSFFVGVLEALRGEPCETILYSNRLQKDQVTARIAAAAGLWHDVYGLGDEALAEQIRGDRVDILFDLAGHTTGNRLLVFARKPAPIAITWIGYEGTTGLAAMDYLLADRRQVPPSSEAHYCERVLRLPGGYLCYDPPADAPPVVALPALGRGQVTFGSFNNPAKLSPPVIEVWGAILRRTAGSRLVLKYKGLDTPGVASRFRELFSRQGISPERLELQGHSTLAESLAAYGRIDLALDPFPFSGSATTCAALWMGVPVVTCAGATFASRHSLGHLTSIGLRETIARNRDDYIRRAVDLTGDLPRLAAIRAGLRERMAGSPLCDAPRLARNLMALLRRVWREQG
jgi:predicted O-linked N-acetylglucosamine transferase (SPINDLY family)